MNFIDKDANLILIVGMYRSGTVWCFNVVKNILEAAHGKENVYARYKTDWIEDEAKNKKQLLMKFHEFDHRLAKRANLTIFSTRDYNDMIASMNRMHEVNKYTDQKLLDYMHPSFRLRVLKDSSEWKKTADIVYSYNDLMNAKLIIASTIANKLNLLTGKLSENNKISYEQLVKILRDVESIPNSSHLPDTGSHDKMTLMHKNHKSEKFNI